MPMTSRRSNQRNAFGRQTEDRDGAKPNSRKGEGRRSAGEAGAAAVNRPKPGRAIKASRAVKNDRTR
jgi:hypothetical protein